MHFVLLPTSETLNKAPISKRLIDDIVLIESNPNHCLTIKALSEEFEKYDLKMVFKLIDTSEPDRQLEFLNVLHVRDQTPKGEFIKKILLRKQPKIGVFK